MRSVNNNCTVRDMALYIYIYIYIFIFIYIYILWHPYKWR